MEQVHLAGLGGGLFLALFAIIVSFFVFQGFDEEAVVKNVELIGQSLNLI